MKNGIQLSNTQNYTFRKEFIIYFKPEQKIASYLFETIFL